MDDLREFAALARRGWLWWSRHGVRSSLDRVADWAADERSPTSQSYAMWSATCAASPCPPSNLLVSIVVPVLDPAPEHLQALVDSVRGQSHGAWELLLVDDGSVRADVRQLLAELAAADERVRLVAARGDGAAPGKSATPSGATKSGSAATPSSETTPGDEPAPTNTGISAATQRGVAVARGEVLLLVDHDDALGHEVLAPLAWAFLRDGRVDLVYTDEDQLTPDGQRVAPVFKPGPSPWLAMGFNYVTHAMALRRSFFDALGGLRSEYDGAQDHDLLLRAFEAARVVVHLPLVGYHWRRTRGSVAASTTAKPWAFEAGRRAIEDACRRRRLPLAQAVAARPPGVWRLQWQPLTTPRQLHVVMHGDRAGWPRWRAFLAAVPQLLSVLSWDEGVMPAVSHMGGTGGTLFVDGALRPDVAVLQELLTWSALPGVLATAAGAELSGRRVHLGYSVDRRGLALPIEPGLPSRAVGPGLLGAAPREVAASGDQLLVIHSALQPQWALLAGEPVTRRDLLCLALAAAAAGAPTLHLPRAAAQLRGASGAHAQPVFLESSKLWPSAMAQLPETFWRGSVDRFCPRHELLIDLGLPAPLDGVSAQSAFWSSQSTV